VSASRRKPMPPPCQVFAHPGTRRKKTRQTQKQQWQRDQQR